MTRYGCRAGELSRVPFTPQGVLTFLRHRLPHGLVYDIIAFTELSHWPALEVLALPPGADLFLIHFRAVEHGEGQ